MTDVAATPADSQSGVHRAIRWLAVVVLSLLLLAAVAAGAFSLNASGGPAALLARDLPRSDAPMIGVDYRAQINCLQEFEAGGWTWRIEGGASWPPPEEWPGIRDIFSSWVVPGIVRFTSAETAVFRAQADASEWQFVRAGRGGSSRCI